VVATPPQTIPEGSVFVVGDNRGQSHDSRFIGPVALSNIVGRVMFRWFSMANDSGVRWERLGQTVE
jgi:signal peptidase I